LSVRMMISEGAGMIVTSAKSLWVLSFVYNTVRHSVIQILQSVFTAGQHG